MYYCSCGRSDAVAIDQTKSAYSQPEPCCGNYNVVKSIYLILWFVKISRIFLGKILFHGENR